MSESKQTFTFLSRTAPYGSSRPRLCLDAALATAVFEQHVNYLFADDGVYQLLKEQQADPIQSKTLGNALETLELYGIQNVFVDAASLKARAIAASDLILPAETISAARMAEIIHNSHHVFVL